MIELIVIVGLAIASLLLLIHAVRNAPQGRGGFDTGAEGSG